ncbi:histidine triad (HIT) family protein [Seinonella peptonophila]|uniref:Histidine triad (HIT) family protein n=1 Tax=Seinonella peptonophila TaxID=112248 RepID=A0A1M4V7Q5_9BACL|nr:histidine triad nucleotide-binding protein [Seinonella peptonophila]SHE65021.1 histidine triad (HIT) family protein [Seinonella peptonophila]
MEECLFCQIVEQKIPSEKVYEDEEFYAFRDIHPAAPVHILLIPKKHVASLMELSPEDEALAGRLLLTAQKIARQFGLDENGFRVVNNIGVEGGQTVFHIHFHLLGGRTLTWPPG